MTARSGGEVVVDHLLAEGITHLIGLCGHGNVGLLDAALERHDELTTISTHHEQVAGFMADGFARVAGRPAATFTSSGPGSVSIQMAIAAAMFDGSPLLAITGNVPTQQFNRLPFQEVGAHYQADLVSAMRPYVKRSYQATRVDMLPGLLRHAFTEMWAGRPGPVHLDVPFNVFVEQDEVATDDPVAWRSGVSRRIAPDPADLQEVVGLLRSAERPLVLAGYGVQQAGAGAQLVRFAEATGLPVATTPQAKGVIPTAHPQSLGPCGRDGAWPANEAGRTCDVLLAVGTRFGDRSASAWIPGATHQIPPTRLIHVDLDPRALARNYPTELGLVADAGAFLAQLTAAFRDRDEADGPSWTAWRQETGSWVRAWRASLAETAGLDTTPLHPDRVVAELQRTTPDEAVVVSDIGAHHSWLVQQWDVPAGGMLLQSGGFAAMGFGVAGALGAKLAAPDRPVVAVVGDGGFLMHASAVATAVEYDLPVVWVVWNNGGYVSIRDLQRGFFGADREIATRFRRGGDGEIVAHDHAAMGRALGADGVTVGVPGELAGALEAALTAQRPTVLDVRVESEAVRRTSGSWDLPPLAGAPPTFDPRG